MTTRADVERLRSANTRLVTMAKRDLAQLFASYDLTRPELVREALLEVVPMLVREYGDIAAGVANEWYDEVRAAANVKGRTPAFTIPSADPEKIEGSVRWAAKDLFGADPEHTLSLLSGAMQRHISYSTRETIRQKVGRDPAGPRYGRVPTGPKTCAWCEMLASRGFVYHSARKAGDLGRGVGDDFHDECDCQVVVEFDAEHHHIDGYDPDAMYARYLKARAKAGGYGASVNDIASQMRRMYPDQYTDGVVDPVN